jgi:hypothetical protein
LVLNELARRAVNQTSDTGLENQYLLLYERVSEELNRGEDGDGDGDEKILSDLQSLNLQRLVYGIDIRGDLLIDGSFEKAFSIIDNEENWNRALDGINKHNLGLTGLAGTGLLLLNAISCPLPFAPRPQLPAPNPQLPAPDPLLPAPSPQPPAPSSRPPASCPQPLAPCHDK